jgi:hypothetical protein
MWAVKPVFDWFNGYGNYFLGDKVVAITDASEGIVIYHVENTRVASKVILLIHFYPRLPSWHHLVFVSVAPLLVVLKETCYALINVFILHFIFVWIPSNES